MTAPPNWIDVADLIGRPYAAGAVAPEGAALDCVGVCATALERMGATAARDELLRAASASEPIEYWGDVGRMIDARLGDIVVSDPGEPSGILHVSCIVRVGPPIAISSCRRLGVFISPALHIKNVVGIYRPSEGGVAA